MESCVLPCLLSGAEAWILSNTLLQKLQAELAKRILRLLKHTSNNVALMALQWPSIRACVLIIKLCFLQKIAKNDQSLSSRVFRSLAVSDVESLLIVRQCRFLESSLQLNLTSLVFTSPEDISPEDISPTR